MSVVDHLQWMFLVLYVAGVGYIGSHLESEMKRDPDVPSMTRRQKIGLALWCAVLVVFWPLIILGIIAVMIRWGRE